LSTAEGRVAPYPGRRAPETAAPASTLAASTSFPALFAALWLCAGILLAQRVWLLPAFLLLGTVFALALTLVAARTVLRSTRESTWGVAWAPLACSWFLLGLFLCEVQPMPDMQRTLSSIADSGGAHVIEGEIERTTPVRLTQSTLPFPTVTGQDRQEQSESIDLRIQSVDGTRIAGGVRATIYGPAGQPFPPLHCGDIIESKIAMHLPEHYLDPGVWDSTAWLRGQGIGVIGSLKLSDLDVHPALRRGGFFCWLHSLQQAGSQRLLDFADSTATASRWPAWLRLNREDAGMLSAMILGDRTYLNREVRAGFERTGSFHLLVVSGMHLAIFAGFIFALATLLRLPSAATTAVTIACSFAYALLTGFGDPVRRSFWMVTLFLLARVLFRERNSLNAIGFAALCMLAWDPRAILDASFQMTLLSVVVIAGVVVPVAEHTFSPYLRATRNLELVMLDGTLRPQIAQFRVSLRLIAVHLQPFLGRGARLLPLAVRLTLEVLELMLASCAIELAMSLPMAAYFHRVTALGLPVNVLVVPLIGVALPAALITFGCILISPTLAMAPATVTAGLLHIINGIVQRAGNMRAGDLRIPAPGTLATVAAILLIAFAVWAARNSRFPVCLSMAALALTAACVFYPQPVLYHPGTLEITAIDVGQGDSLLLVSPQGRTLLIDAGGPTGGAGQPSTSNFEIGEDVVSPVLWTRRIRHLDAVELTHAHSDHMGGMPAVLRNFRPKELWVGKNPGVPAYEALLEEAHSLGIQVHAFSAGDSFDFGGAHIEVLSPARDYQPGRAPSNDDSLVLHVAYGHTSVLLEGDAQARSEARMLGEDLRADLLKVGHHGSKTSTIPPFLAAVHPKYAIISVGHRNPYGHPRIEVLDHLQEDQVRTFRTDALGATTFYLDGESVTAHPLAER
jgi:competence protein ComEC